MTRQVDLLPHHPLAVPRPETGPDPLERYFTPAWMTRALLEELDVEGRTVLEPAAGQLHIADELVAAGAARVDTWDIDVESRADRHCNYLLEPLVYGEVWDAVITNPPFSLAAEFLQASLGRAPIVAMLLRCTWVEPTDSRAELLERFPPVRTIALPRGSFLCHHANNDSAPAFWFLWGQGVEPGHVSKGRKHLGVSNG